MQYLATRHWLQIRQVLEVVSLGFPWIGLDCLAHPQMLFVLIPWKFVGKGNIHVFFQATFFNHSNGPVLGPVPMVGVFVG